MAEMQVHFDKKHQEIDIVKGEHKTPLFVDGIWGIVNFKNADSKLDSCRFFASYQSVPQISEGFESIDFLFFERKSHKRLTVKLNDNELSGDEVLRVSFFAASDIGTIIVSYVPSWGDDARPLVMSLGGKRKYDPLLRHLGVNWLYEIFDQKF